jgi:MFS family permease
LIKKNIYLLYAITFLQGMVFYAPIATLYRQSRGLTVFQITLIESISLVVCLILEIPWGFVADKIGYRKTLLFCYFLLFLSKIIFWQAHSFGMFLAERLMIAVVISGLSGCDSAFLYLSADGEKAGISHKVFGIYEAMGTAGMLLASMIYSLFLSHNYDLTALLTVFSYGIAVFLMMFSTEVENSVENPATFQEQAKQLFSAFKGDKSFLLFLFAAALLSECDQTINTFLNQLQYVRGGISPALMGYFYIAVTAAGLVAARSHKLVKRFGENKVSVFLFVTGGGACLIMTFFANPFLSVMCLILLRLASSLFVPIKMGIQNRRITTGNRAAMLSVYAIIMDSIAVVTNLLYGKAADYGVSYAMLLGTVFCFAALILFLVWKHMEARNCGISEPLPIEI